MIELLVRGVKLMKRSDTESLEWRPMAIVARAVNLNFSHANFEIRVAQLNN